MRRRDFIAALAATTFDWRQRVRAEAPAVPIVGILGLRSADDSPEFMVAFRRALSIRRLEASSPAAIDSAFAMLARHPSSALIVTSDPFLGDQRERMVALAKQHRIPVISFERDFVESGGLMSYGSNVEDAYRLCANYIIRVLKGDKPTDLPVLQPTRFELVVNLQTARALGLTIPQSILLRADEVVE